MKREPRASVTLRLPAVLADRLEAEAEARVVSRSFLVARALERYFDALPPVPDGPTIPPVPE